MIACGDEALARAWCEWHMRVYLSHVPETDFGYDHELAAFVFDHPASPGAPWARFRVATCRKRRCDLTYRRPGGVPPPMHEREEEKLGGEESPTGQADDDPLGWRQFR